MVHPYYGDVVICANDDGTQHAEAHSRTLDSCEDCGDTVVVCADEHRCISCCYCGNYHSADCPWPL
jgi:hypothetical protein